MSLEHALEQMLLQSELQENVETGYADAALVSSFYLGLLASGLSQDIAIAFAAQYLAATISSRALYGGYSVDEEV